MATKKKVRRKKLVSGRPIANEIRRAGRELEKLRNGIDLKLKQLKKLEARIPCHALTIL